MKLSRSMGVADQNVAIFSPQLNPHVKPAAKHGGLAGSYPLPMDVSAIRLANLRAITERLMRPATRGGEPRTKRAVATDLDLAASYLSQLLGGKRMGDDVARKLESRLGLPFGSMDRLSEDGARFAVAEPLSGYGSQSVRVDPTTIAEAIKLVRLAFQILDTPHDPETDGVPVALAYEFLVSRSERGVTPDNLVEFSKKLVTARELEVVDHEAAGSNRSTGAGDRRAS